MPFFFTLRRTKNITNEESLEYNKKLAVALISSFKEIHDSQVHQDYLFLKTSISQHYEFPDLHFRLEAEIVDNCILINFWKDFICFEFGLQKYPETLFKSLKDYAEIIIPYGFQIEHPNSETLMNLATGLAVNIEEYFLWCGMVNQVLNITNQ